ncbi:MAG: low molecular weight protein-tyrosine-phosphatase [SAR324 cluster bacterium]|nr:low molecular weight protein-tyrosine-phosphatase [SAR324 cluster bacterium]
MTESSKKTTKILFICMGNICRSPSAEAVMQALVKQQGMEKEIFCDSAGTLDYHRGKPADARMQKHALLRGYELNSISRPFEYDDFELFDWIITMDEDNYQQIKWFDQRINYADKIRRMTEFCNTAQVSEVPDPYYGGKQGFENVLDLLEDACQGLLEFVTLKKT